MNCYKCAKYSTDSTDIEIPEQFSDYEVCSGWTLNFLTGTTEDCSDYGGCRKEEYNFTYRHTAGTFEAFEVSVFIQYYNGVAGI